MLEGQQPLSAPITSHYDRTKWQAHMIVKEFIERGLPAVITMPGIVFGVGDHSVYGEALNFFLKGWLLVVPGSETGLTYIHVKDVAAALILAAEKGKPGEYITSGPCYTVSELIDLWAEVSGRSAPRIHIPAALVRPSWPLMQLLGYLVPLPQMLSGEVTRIIGVTYYGGSDKAKRELGWAPHSEKERLKETLIEMGFLKA
jgi:nucleoside-diphosphate-sugar epimerase